MSFMHAHRMCGATWEMPSPACLNIHHHTHTHIKIIYGYFSKRFNEKERYEYNIYIIHIWIYLIWKSAIQLSIDSHFIIFGNRAASRHPSRPFHIHILYMYIKTSHNSFIQMFTMPRAHKRRSIKKDFFTHFLHTSCTQSKWKTQTVF